MLPSLTMSRITLPSLQLCKQQQEKIAVLTAYDASFASQLDAAGIDIILVGDSLGMVLQGHDTTLPVTLEQMVYHIECVARKTQCALIIGDMPFLSYATPEITILAAQRFMQAGAHCIKLEGGSWLTETIQLLKRNGVPVCGHLGLTPQSVHVFGGYKVQGREAAAAKSLLEEAIALEQAGIDLIVLECIPAKLAHEVTQTLKIPTIGIGAGPDTDGQVLVLYDMLGIYPGHRPSFSMNFLSDITGGIPAALTRYVQAVKNHEFPLPAMSFK